MADETIASRPGDKAARLGSFELKRAYYVVEDALTLDGKGNPPTNRRVAGFCNQLLGGSD